MIITFSVTFRNKIDGREQAIGYNSVNYMSYFHAWKMCIDEAEKMLVQKGYDWYIKSIEHIL